MPIWFHLNKYNIITIKQHGFQSGKSCVTQLVEAMNDWTSTLNQSIQVDVLLLDFSEAFDVVPHHRLLCTLEMYGISDMTSKRIARFLTGQTQEVVITGTTSDIGKVSSGVPQGTVLGPLLFLPYIYDIEKGLHDKMRLFANDFTL